MTSERASELEAMLRQRRLPELFGDELGEELVLPEYDAHSLVNVPATLAELLGVSLPGVAPALDSAYWQTLASGVRRVVVVLLDALGYLQLGQMLQAEPDGLWPRLAHQGMLLPMTSIVPSTTNAALMTLMTGYEPVSHGILGYELWLREYGVLAEMLALKPVYGTGKETLMDWGLVPEQMVPVPGVGALLATEGVRTTAMVPAPFTRSALTRMLYRGFQQMYGFTSVDGLWALTRYVFGQDTSERSIYFVYWGAIDKAAHEHGSAGGHWQAQYRAVSQACDKQFLSQLGAEERRGTLLVMIADHGFVDTPADLAYDTECDSPLRHQLMIPFSGESRAAYLHTCHGADDITYSQLQGALGPDFVVRPTEQTLRAGLWGPRSPAPESLARLGQFVAIARGQHYLDRKNLRNKLRGRHGGLSAAEMLVPWLAVRLDAL
jgi:hypothetical protein